MMGMRGRVHGHFGSGSFAWVEGNGTWLAVTGALVFLVAALKEQGLAVVFVGSREEVSAWSRAKSFRRVEADA